MTSDSVLAIGSTAQDLKRVASFIGRGSVNNAARFLEEALKNKQTIKLNLLPSYLRVWVAKIDNLPAIRDPQLLAEEALTIGCMLQNAVLAAARR